MDKKDGDDVMKQVLASLSGSPVIQAQYMADQAASFSLWAATVGLLIDKRVFSRAELSQHLHTHRTAMIAGGHKNPAAVQLLTQAIEAIRTMPATPRATDFLRVIEEDPKPDEPPD